MHARTRDAGFGFSRPANCTNFGGMARVDSIEQSLAHLTGCRTAVFEGWGELENLVHLVNCHRNSREIGRELSAFSKLSP
jgi:hypothetical protein